MIEQSHVRKFLDDCRFWRSGEPILGLTGLNDINSVTTCPLCQAACVGILTMSNQYSHSALNIPVFPSKFHSHSHFAPYKQARAPDSHACLLVAWIPWKHSVISCTPSIHVVHIRCPLSALSFCASGTRRSFLTRTAACHISLVHTKSLSSLVVRRSSVHSKKESVSLRLRELIVGSLMYHPKSKIVIIQIYWRTRVSIPAPPACEAGALPMS